MGRFAFQNPLPCLPPCSSPGIRALLRINLVCVAFEIYRMRRMKELRCRTSLMLRSGDSGISHAICLSILEASSAKAHHLLRPDMSTDTVSQMLIDFRLRKPRVRRLTSRLLILTPHGYSHCCSRHRFNPRDTHKMKVNSRPNAY